jgi:hypothetical protein
VLIIFLSTSSNINEDKLNNELTKGDDGGRSQKVPEPTGGLPVVNRLKGISIILDEVDKKIMSTIKDKGVAMSTYKISDCCGVDVKDVHNILEKLESEDKVARKQIGTDDYWIVK